MKILFGIVVSLFLIQGCSSNQNIKPKNNTVKNTYQKKQITNRKSVTPKRVLASTLAKQKKA